ncbi:MAG: hypothetical protein PHE49_09670 [bacterium]|nr:hypothetical protein [bacterium]
MWIKKYLIPFLIFCVLAAVMTYPLILKMGNSLLWWGGDQLFTTWTVEWVQHKIITGLHNFWDANIFHPYSNTLAYSDHMIGVALLSFPVALIFKNPILTHNFAFLLSFVLSGFGMYLLVLYLTKNRYAGILSGIIFAFSHFRFAQIAHLQILTMEWMPFIFLYLHKFFDTHKWKNLFLFVFFFILQSWSSCYYSLFLPIFVAFFCCFYLISQRESYKIWLKLFLSVGIIALFIIPFAYPYILLQHTTGAFVDIPTAEIFSADVLSYMRTYRHSLVYGKSLFCIQKLLENRGKSAEITLFPGIIAILLVIGAFIKKNKYQQVKDSYKKWIPLLFNSLIFFLLVISIYIIIWKKVSLLDAYIGGYSLRKPIVFILFLIIIRLIIDKQWFAKWKCFFTSMSEAQKVYFFLGVLGFLLSLGPSIFLAGRKIWSWWTPYAFLYEYFPGYNGVRMSGRFGLFVLFAISVFAGYGATKIQNLKLKSCRSVNCFYLMVCFMVLVENFCGPIKLYRIPVRKEIPQVYNWLAKEKGDFPIIELPMSDSLILYDTRYEYYSIYHWKKLVNGYSGYFPFEYKFLRSRMTEFPSDRTINKLRHLEVKYVILHKKEFLDSYYNGQTSWNTIDENLQLYKNKIFLIKDFGDDIVYEVVNSKK